jgi:hypothetical protein
MDQGFAFVALFAVFGFGLVGLLAYFGYLAAKKRREEFAALAAARGWTYAESDDRYVDRYAGAPFGLGHDRQANNVLTGAHDSRPFAAFDYRYSTTSTSTDAQGHTSTHTEVHNFSVIALEVGVRLPELSVTPEGFFGRLIGRLTNNDIEFESEQFNRAFTVHCEDRKFATDVIHPRMMEYLLTVPDLAWSFRDSALVTVSPGDHSVPLLEQTLGQVDGILDLVPEFVWKEVRP